MNPKLKELLGKYASLDFIPKSELELIGYKRTKKWNGSSFTTKLVPKDKQDTKPKTPPFETLEVKVKGGKVFHPISGKRAFCLRRKVARAIEYFEEKTDISELPYKDDDSKYEAHIHLAKEQISNIFSNIPEIIESFQDYYTINVFGGLLKNSGFNYEQLNLMLRDIETSELTSEKIEESYNVLQKERAKLLDLDELKKAYFNDILKSDFNDYIELLKRSKFEECDFDEEILSHLPQDLTIESLLLSHVPDYLKRQGYTSLAKESENSSSLEALIELLLKSTNYKLPGYGNYNSLSKRMKNATPEGKRLISESFKKAKVQLKNERQFLEDLISFLQPYEIFSQVSDSVLKPILNDLEERGEKVDKTWTLDARPNKEIDLKDDPLKDIDCQGEKPLPFNRPDTHKIKVYEGQNYIGEIYLLETSTRGNIHYPVWHLDAIQIPRNLDWTKTLPNLVSALRSAAEQKGIYTITVNKDIERISNFDYIGKAVIEFTKEKYKTRRVELVIPKIDNPLYSDFQYQTSARILWRKTNR